MHDDSFDEVAGLEKSNRPLEGPASWRRWSRRDVLLIALTVPVCWVLSCGYYSPSTHDVQTLEAHRTRPIFHIDVAETHGARPGEMDLTIDLSNLGYPSAEIVLMIQPLGGRASIDHQATVEVTPAVPITTRIGSGNATIQLKNPLAAGAGLSIAIRGIKTAFPAGWKYGRKESINVNVIVGKEVARLSFFRSLRAPKPSGDK